MTTKKHHQRSSYQAKHLYIIDLMSMAFRHFHALSRGSFVTSLGFPTSALYGTARTLFQLYSQEQPDYIVAASDSKAPTFRHKIYGNYKCSRKEMPEELAVQLPKLFELLHLLGIPVITKSGWEADDIIATLVKNHREPTTQQHSTPLQIRIMTGDKDMMQLVDENTMLYQTSRQQQTSLVGAEEVEHYFGVPPHKVVLAQALIGDPIDDIPGVAGVGKTTAAKLLKNISSLDELYANLDALSSKNLKEKLLCGKENAYISEQLVTLATNVELAFSLNDAAVQSWQWGDDNPSLNKFFQKCEFRTLRKRYLSQSPDLPALIPFTLSSNSNVSEHHTTEPLSHDPGGHEHSQEQEVAQLIDETQVKTYLSGVQRYELSPIRRWQLTDQLLAQIKEAQYLVISAIAKDDGEGGVHLLLAHQLHEFWQAQSYEISGSQATWAQDPGWLDFLTQLISNQQVMVVVYDGKQLMHQLVSWGLNPVPYSFTDVQIIEGLVLARESSRSLLEAARRQLGPTCLSLLHQGSADDESPHSHNTGALATLMTTLLYLKWRTPAYRLDEMQYVLRHIETPLSFILFDMETRGVYLDKPRLTKYAKWLEAEMTTTSEQIYQLSGHSFNIQSPKQLAKIIYEKLKLHEKSKVKLKKTKSQSFSTRESALVKLLPHPLIVAVLRYRKLAKLKGTYAQALPELINPHTGRLHTSYNQMGTATGRMSSERPNLQNIPIRTELGKEIRRAFCATDSDHTIISADYSQIELRVLAHLSQDQNLIAAFNADQDIHNTTAAQMLQKPLDQLTPQDREMAKAINYGIVYGMGPRRLAVTLGTSFKRAAGLIEEYFRQFPKVAEYMKDVEQFAEQHGYTMTYNGRMRKVDSRESSRGGAGVARNSPIQGTAADLMKLAMIRVHGAITAAQIDCAMLLQIHDELLFECAQTQVKAAMSIIVTEMEAAENFQVPLKVTIGAGEHWLAAH